VHDGQRAENSTFVTLNKTIAMIKETFRVTCLLAFIFVQSFSSKAAIKLPYFFSDNMVLQQQTDAVIWGWANAGSNVQVTTSWNKAKYSAKADANGKWKLKVKTPVAGGPFSITISDGTPVTLKNVLIGEVWLCSGQSNMEMPMKGFRDQPIHGANDAVFNSANDQIRLYTVPRSVQRTPQDTTKASPWKLAEPEAVNNFSATAYYFGKMLHEKLKVPIGLVNISYGGSPVEAFMDAETLKQFPELKVPSPTDTARLNNRTPTVLYNGMLKSFLGYAIKGCLWYQGESNNDRPKQYETLFPAFVKQIREQSNQGDFPFYYCQIAPYNYNNYAAVNVVNNNSAYLRDAQRKALAKIPNSGMAVLMDIGEEFGIHPMDKLTGSKRLAYMALAKTYGLKGFGYESPAFESMTVSGNIVTIKFSGAPNGLTVYGKSLQLFEVAGANKVFRPAKAVISGGTIIVSATDVKEPIAVRYAFKDFCVGDLFSTEGFPVSSFRSDDW
jgi:sialate O-acetylesterase